MKNQQLAVKDKIPGKTIKIAPFRKDIRQTVAHRHNSYVELIYLLQGRGYHTIDSEGFAINTTPQLSSSAWHRPTAGGGKASPRG